MAKANVLSREVNRLLGDALLDAGMRQQLLGPDRASALSGYKLTRTERRAVLGSKARSLSELACDCATALGQPNEEPSVPSVDTLCRNYGINQVPTSFIRGAIERLLHPKPVLSEWSSEQLAG